MPVFVRELNGATITIDVAQTEPIESVRVKIQAVLGYAPQEQRLIFAGRQLEDGRTLQDYGIQRDSTIHLVRRLIAPLSTGAPAISGTPMVGEMLATSDGAWSPAPTALAYSWEACTTAAASSCTSLPGTAATLTVPSDAVGLYVRAIVTASNAIGATAAATATAGPVAAAPALAAAPAAPAAAPGPGPITGRVGWRFRHRRMALHGGLAFDPRRDAVSYRLSRGRGLRIVRGRVTARRPGSYTVRMTVRTPDGTSRSGDVAVRIASRR